LDNSANCHNHIREMGMESMRNKHAFKFAKPSDEMVERRKATYLSKDNKVIAKAEKKAVHDLANGIESPELKFKMWQMTERG